jgi:DNA-binding NtrC family response regulator
VAVEVEHAQALLIGRDPLAGRIDPTVLPGDKTVETLRIDDASVSANHLVAWSEAQHTSLIDPGSRNGTWLKLPPGDRVDVFSRQRLAIQLAAPIEERTASEPAVTDWSGRNDYGEAIARAVRRWLHEQGFEHSRVVLDAARADDDAVHEIPLANGQRLQLDSERTTDARWHRTLERLWEWVAKQNLQFAAEDEARNEGLILASRAIRTAHAKVVEAAQRGLRCVLMGPSGAGKDGLARSYHRRSGRSGPLVAKNCAMLNKEMLRVELFGAEEGAFTGAVRRLLGAVERAHQGTLFLDEIGEMARELQPMLLTFLDHGEFERLGGAAARSSDVRVIAATNRNLREATLRGEFREDLWYRLAGCVVEVPPLSERTADIDAYLASRQVPGGVSLFEVLTDAAMAEVRAHAWPGNFRELAGFADRLALERGPIDRSVCRAAIADGALERPRAAVATAEPSSQMDLAAAAATAAAAFRDDFSHEPATWDDVKDFVEKYFKPVVFSRMSGANTLADRRDADIPALAASLAVDRGTVVKQLARYFERFAG